ncbi:MAG: molybdenum cofactor guanylyltransferase [Deltaproteobacteria bacterium]
MLLPITGALLCGGAGSRLGGRWKGELMLEGQSLFERALGFLASFCAERLVLPGPHSVELPPGVRAIPDALLDRGPPGALLAALEAASQPHVFVLAVDMPFPSEPAARALFERRADADAVLYRRLGHPEPLFALYARRCAAPFRVRLERQSCSLMGLLSGVATALVPLGEAPAADGEGRFLESVNTPEDAERLGLRFD